MLAANPVDPSRVIAIDFLEPHGPSVPYPRRSGRALPIAATLITAGVLAFAAAAMGGGRGAGVEAADAPAAKGAPALATPMPGEFRLGPGNNQPPGIAVPASGSRGPVRGEFRLGPGNNQPPGIAVPASGSLGPVRGEFRLGPGNNQPLGIGAEH